MATNWATIGNVTNVFILSLTVAYAVAVFGHGIGWWVLEAFGKNWAADGFCISFKGTLAHTHLLCFYGDTIFTVFLLWLTNGTTRPELLHIRKSLLSVFFHGVAHALLWVNEQHGYGKPSSGAAFFNDSPPPWLVAISGLGGVGFWVSFLCMQGSPLPFWFNLVQSVVHTVATLWAVPVLLIFCYVNTVLFFNITGTQLLFGLGGERDVFYAANSIAAMSIMAATWAEPYFCDAALINLGGHILFDFMIPFSYVVLFVITSALPPRECVKTD